MKNKLPNILVPTINFLLLILWCSIICKTEDMLLSDFVSYIIAYIGIRFLCVTVHELGHAFCAIKHRIKVLRIIICNIIIDLERNVKVRIRLKGNLLFGGCVIISVKKCNTQEKFEQLKRAYPDIILGGIKSSLYLFLLSFLLLFIAIILSKDIVIYAMFLLLLSAKILTLTITTNGAVNGDYLNYKSKLIDADSVCEGLYNNLLLDYNLNTYLYGVISSYYYRHNTLITCHNLIFLQYAIADSIIVNRKLREKELDDIDKVWEYEKGSGDSLSLSLSCIKISYSFLIYEKKEKSKSFYDDVLIHNSFVEKICKRHHINRRVKDMYIIKKTLNAKFIENDLYLGLYDYDTFIEHFNNALSIINKQGE